jgi:hypothetical protein
MIAGLRIDRRLPIRKGSRVYKGTMASDSEIKFTRTVADIIMEEFVAKRSK